jgi:hypothetical protein
MLLLASLVSGHPMVFKGTMLVARSSGQMIEDGSTELWASVVANVAPLMALVGERNAKEYMRVASSRTQLFLMASAPLGILSILVSAVRLSGPRLLRRLLGRESDRRSEALVELTPLSVEPATSAYTPGGVEIEPSFDRNRVAFVCGHVQETENIKEAVEAFKKLAIARNGKVDASRDFETIIGLKELNLSLEETARLVTSIITEKSTIDSDLLAHASSASLSFRATGISPSQTTLSAKTLYGFLKHMSNTFAGLFFCFIMIGIQVLGYRQQSLAMNDTRLQALLMGISGYVGIALFAFLLLVLLQDEVQAEPQEIPNILNNAVWTISDARHAEHRLITMSAQATLAIASPSIFTTGQKRKREAFTSLFTIALVGSYITYYLGLRAAPWWVGFCHVVFIWLAAGYRATVTKNILVATEGQLGEHWLGAFHDTLYDSFLKLTTVLEQRPKTTDRVAKETLISSIEEDSTTQSTRNGTNTTRLFIAVKPIRQSLRNWSGCEDIMKVSLEMAKQVCRTKACSIPYIALQPPKFDSVPEGKFTSWGGIYRFQLMIYVPGLIWTARRSVDYVRTEQEFDMPNLYRDLFKLLHLCADYEGDIAIHSVPELEGRQLSDTLCGPVHCFNEAQTPRKTTLANLLVLLRDTNSVGQSSPKSYSLEQAILLPTIQLAAMYEDSHARAESVIGVYQSQHIDKLQLSGGGKWLDTLDQVLEREGIWAKFMQPKSSTTQTQPLARDSTSGLLPGGVQNNQESQWLHPDRVGVSYDKNLFKNGWHS